MLKVLCSKVMALFTISISAAIHDILPVSYSYPHNTDIVSFVLMAMSTMWWSLLYQEDPSESVGVHDWLKHSFCITHTYMCMNAGAACAF